MQIIAYKQFTVGRMVIQQKSPIGVHFTDIFKIGIGSAQKEVIDGTIV